MSMRVHVRPNAAHLALLLLGACLIAFGIAWSGVARYAMVFLGVVLVVLLGYPVVSSTICRIPAVVVEPDGLRLPLLGVRLGWPEVARVRRGTGPANRPVLLVHPVDPAATIARMRPWLRRQARTEMARFGAPIVLQQASLSRSVTEIEAAIDAARSGSAVG